MVSVHSYHICMSNFIIHIIDLSYRKRVECWKLRQRMFLVGDNLSRLCPFRHKQFYRTVLLLVVSGFDTINPNDVPKKCNYA